MEVVTACLILGICLSIMVPIQRFLVHSQSNQQNHLAKFQKRRILETQFDAQWRRIGKFGCSGLSRSIVIGSESNFPLSNKASLFGSDWLSGEDVGQCVAEFHGESHRLIGEFSDCAVGNRTQYRLDVCSGSSLVNMMPDNTGRFSIALPVSLTEASGLIATSELSVWYLAKSRSGLNGLWKKSDANRVAQELEAGIAYIAFYPLLDTNGDGHANLITREYGVFSTDQLIAVWVEYIYLFGHCAGSAPHIDYRSFRSKNWSYQPSCEALGGYLLPVGVT